MNKIGAHISSLKNLTVDDSNHAKTGKIQFDAQLARQRRAIGTPIKTSPEPQVPTIQLGKVISAAARDTGRPAAVYDTTRTVGLGDLVGSLSRGNQPGAESKIQAALNHIPQGEMPEVAIVSADSLGESDVTFKSALIGDTMFLSEKVYDNWCSGKDEGQLETALDDLTTNWLRNR